MMLGTSAGSVIGSADLVMLRMAATELKFGSMWARRRGYPIGSTSTGTLSP